MLFPVRRAYRKLSETGLADGAKGKREKGRRAGNCIFKLPHFGRPRRRRRRSVRPMRRPLTFL